MIILQHSHVCSSLPLLELPSPHFPLIQEQQFHNQEVLVEVPPLRVVHCVCVCLELFKFDQLNFIYLFPHACLEI